MKCLPLIVAVAIKTACAGTASITLTNVDDAMWYGSISVGSPAKTFRVGFDTGSPDLLLPGPDCSTCEGHTLFDPMSSTTATDLKRTFAISFDGQSQVSGNVYSDTVNFGGLVATEQGLGVATSYRGLDVDTFPADGILGMAFPEISTTKTLPLVNSLIGQGQMDEAAFSFKFANDGGELFLGGANPDLYTGDFTYLPVTKQEFWTVQADGLEMGGKTVISNFGAVIDTLSTAIVLTKEQAATFMNVTGAKNESSELGAGFLSFPCKKMPSLSLSITLGGVSFPINPGTLNMGLVSQGNENCVAGITIAQNDDPDAIIGLAFLRNVYTKFDAGNSRVGFAHLA